MSSYSLSHGSFMRRLSVQPEESGTDLDGETDGEQKEPDEPLMPLSFHQPSPHPSSAVFTCGSGSCEITDEDDDENYLRRLSLTSLGSVKSSGSLSGSTCSAPPGGMVTLGGSESSSAILCNRKDYQEDQNLYCQPSSTRKMITSRPSFISLCSIVSETSEVPRKFLPAPLQVELDLMQRNGIEGDEPKLRSHLPILRCPSDYDINELNYASDGLFRRNNKISLVSGFKQIPSRIRKLSTEKNRFDIYSVSDETREQLKQLYVY